MGHDVVPGVIQFFVVVVVDVVVVVVVFFFFLLPDRCTLDIPIAQRLMC